jgi:plastocyanin
MVHKSRGVAAALAAAVAAAVMAGAGVASGAADDTTIAAVGDSTEGAWSQPAVTIDTGDTVTWTFAGTNTHNIASSNTSELDPRWESYAYKGEYMTVTDGTAGSFTFYKHGTYAYVCQFHPAMTGQIVVEGPDQDIPAEPTPTPTPSPTPTPTPPGDGGTQPSPPPADDHTTTPAPSPAVDRTKPAISRVKLRALKRAARVSFRLSEPASVTLSVRKGKRAVRTLRLQASAGTRTVTVRSRKLRKGRYTLTLRARDAMGNRSATKRSLLRIRR